MVSAGIALPAIMLSLSAPNTTLTLPQLEMKCPAVSILGLLVAELEPTGAIGEVGGDRSKP